MWSNEKLFSSSSRSRSTWFNQIKSFLAFPCREQKAEAQPELFLPSAARKNIPLSTLVRVINALILVCARCWWWLKWMWMWMGKFERRLKWTWKFPINANNSRALHAKVKKKNYLPTRFNVARAQDTSRCLHSFSLDLLRDLRAHVLTLLWDLTFL